MNSALLESLGDYAHSIAFDRVPEVVIREAILTIADTVGCMASGSAVPEVDMLLRAEQARGGRGEISVIGRQAKLTPESAARVNAYMGDIHELNDLTCGHSGIGNVAGMLALAERTGATGAQLIEALVAGIEVTCRIYSAFYDTMRPYTEVGMVSVGPCGAAGVAAGSAKLLGLDRDGLVDAMANALAQAGWCPAEVIFGDGGSVKPLMFGSMPAADGILGALCAQSGITGPHRILEGPMGYLQTVGKSWDSTPLLDADTWYLASPRRKYHACCGYLHSALDAVIDLRNEGVDRDAVSRIAVHMPEYIIPAVSKARPPGTPNEARFHAQYCLGLGLASADIIEPRHSDMFDVFLADSEVSRLASCICVEADPELRHYHQSRVFLYDASGKLLAYRQNDAPKGSPRNALTGQEVWDKFRRLTQSYCPVVDIENYIERLMALTSSSETDWIVGSFSRAWTEQSC